eukprot:TCALIF_07008-PA protein Name:"Protein of unknown function" AED:0.11 eAED:0.11 QI:0/0.66/0.5/0.75/0/0.25/4/63/169
MEFDLGDEENKSFLFPDDNVTLAVEIPIDAINNDSTHSTLDTMAEENNTLAALNISFEGMVEQFTTLNLTEADTLPILNGFQDFFQIVWNLFSECFSKKALNVTEAQFSGIVDNSTSSYYTTLQGFGAKILSLKTALGTLESESVSTVAPMSGALSIINGTNSSPSDVA